MLLLLVAGLCIYGAVEQLILGRPFGNNPASDEVLVLTIIVFGLGLPVFMHQLCLMVEVYEDGLRYRFYPLQLSFRKLGREEIISFEAVTYRPIRDYGGWGIKYGRNGAAYNVSGNRGVQLQLTDGRRMLFGSQRPEELASALRTITKK